MLVLGTKLDYGLQIMVNLAKKQLDTDSFISLRQIAKEEKLPLQYLAQISMLLKENALLSSKEGKGGGYKLAKMAKDIKVLDIINSIDGPISLVKCFSKNSECERMFCKNVNCQAKNYFNIFINDIQKYFKNISLEDLVKSNDKNTFYKFLKNNFSNNVKK